MSSNSQGGRWTSLLRAVSKPSCRLQPPTICPSSSRPINTCRWRNSGYLVSTMSCSSRHKAQVEWKYSTKLLCLQALCPLNSSSLHHSSPQRLLQSTPCTWSAVMRRQLSVIRWLHGRDHGNMTRPFVLRDHQVHSTQAAYLGCASFLSRQSVSIAIVTMHCAC